MFLHKSIWNFRKWGVLFRKRQWFYVEKLRVRPFLNTQESIPALRKCFWQKPVNQYRTSLFIALCACYREMTKSNLNGIIYQNLEYFNNLFKKMNLIKKVFRDIWKLQGNKKKRNKIYGFFSIKMGFTRFNKKCSHQLPSSR